MENKELLLSICIPTNGVVEWVAPVIESIYAQGVDNALFEVVITDNGVKDDLQEAVKKLNYPNLNYSRNNSKGFTNQIDAFEKCQGVFCKMLNHRSKMLPGSISAVLDIVRKYQDRKPILYFAEGLAKGGEYIECTNTDAFIKSLGVWSSWSSGTGCWREDLLDIRNKEIDTYFPHTVFLFGLRRESEYVIWNGKYTLMADDAGKGGYDLFQTFSVGYLDLINKLRIEKRISQDTFLRVKADLFEFLKLQYLVEVVLPTKHKFIIGNIKNSLKVYYSTYHYYIMAIEAYLKAPYYYISLKLDGKGATNK